MLGLCYCSKRLLIYFERRIIINIFIDFVDLLHVVCCSINRSDTKIMDDLYSNTKWFVIVY